MKLLLTGDLHLGRSYQKERPIVRNQYVEARLEAFRNVVKIGNEENCDVLVIAGDLFDKTYGISLRMLEAVAQILRRFYGDVLILPGNHDYCDSGQDGLWSKFQDAAPSNVLVLCEETPVEYDEAVFYPCICHDRWSKENALGWLKSGLRLDPYRWNIGVAHGAVEGFSQDSEKGYYSMTVKELLGCNMDLWLLGHTHVPFQTADGRVLNAGTHQQTDISDNSRGEVFIIELGGNKQLKVSSRKTGVLNFVRKEIYVQHGQRLREAFRLYGLDPASTSLRLILSGSVCSEDWEAKEKIYDRYLSDFVAFEVKDQDLHKEITSDMIDQETVIGTNINRLLHSYQDDPEVLNLAFDIAKACMAEENSKKRG